MPVRKFCFPHFGNGDLEIILSPAKENRLVLHSTVLTSISPYFRAGLSEKWFRTKLNTQVHSKNILLRYRLQQDEEAEDWLLVGANETLFVSESEAESTPAADTAAEPDDDEEPPLYTRDKSIAAHRAMFAIVYHDEIAQPRMDEASDVDFIDDIIHYADFYALIHAVSDHLVRVVRAALRKHPRWIADRPCIYLRMACKLKSEDIFDDAMRHAAGKAHSQISLDDEYLYDNDALEPAIKEHVEYLSQRLRKTNEELLNIAICHPQWLYGICVSDCAESVWRKGVVEHIFSDCSVTDQLLAYESIRAGGTSFNRTFNVSDTLSPLGLGTLIPEGSPPYLGVVDSLAVIRRQARHIIRPLFADQNDNRIYPYLTCIKQPDTYPWQQVE